VIPGFMVQGGGFTSQMQQKETKAPIKNEPENGLHNVRGTCPWPAPRCRIRPPASFSSTSRTTISSTSDDGYAVFGKVVKGMDVVDIIVNSPTTTKSGMQRRAGRSGVHQVGQAHRLS
jgi:peptidyl-prolyl cis-trans isomerase A (cyclophilin A)